MKIEKLDYDEYSKIHYYNDGMSYRILIIDKNNKVIQDELTEYDEHGKRIADVVFASDHTTIIAKREYTDNGFCDYRKIGDNLILVSSNTHEWLIPDKKLKSSFYDAKGNLVFYDIFEKDDDENIGMVIMGSFDKHDVQFFGKTPDEIKALQSYSDY